MFIRTTRFYRIGKCQHTEESQRSEKKRGLRYGCAKVNKGNETIVQVHVNIYTYYYSLVQGGAA